MANQTALSNVTIKNIGKIETTVLSTASNQRLACVGLSLANLTAGPVSATVYVTSGGVKATYIKNISIAPNAAARIVNGGEKLILSPSNVVSVVCDSTNAIDAVASFATITTV